jgi:hypothetical protein
MLFSKRFIICILFLICALSALTFGVSAYEGEKEVKAKLDSLSPQMSADEYYDTLQYLRTHIASYQHLAILITKLSADRKTCSMYNEDPQSIDVAEGVEFPSCSDEYFFEMIDWLYNPAMLSFTGNDDMLMEMFPALFDAINQPQDNIAITYNYDLDTGEWVEIERSPEPRPTLCYDGDEPYES